MIGEPGGLHLYQVRLYMFNYPAADGGGKQFTHGAMDRRWSGKRPAFRTFAPNDFSDMLGELFANPSIGFGLERCPFRDRIGVASVAIADRKASGLIRQFVVITPMGVGEIKGLN